MINPVLTFFSCYKTNFCGIIKIIQIIEVGYMRKARFLYFLLICFIMATIFFGTKIVLSNINGEKEKFTKDGYALTLNNNNKSLPLAFSSGTTYNYKKFDNKISFLSDKKEVKVDDNTLIHYQDNSILVLKNTVGLNLNLIDNDIIFYYNIFKDTEIKFKDKRYYLETKDNDEITFAPLLLRIDENKFLLGGKNIRVLLGNDEIIDFDSYLYIEYVDGSIVRLYNNEKVYQTIVDNANIAIDDISINLKKEEISKNGKKYISLSNLVIDSDSNIDVLLEDETNKESLDSEEENAIINKTDVDEKNLNGEVTKEEKKDDTTSTTNNSATEEENNATKYQGDGTTLDEDEEEVVSDDTQLSEPVYKVTKLSITSLALDATIEITDDDALITSPTEISIVENATSRTVYETSIEAGDLSGNIAYPDLKPDTEYTLVAKATYKMDNVEYDKNFISKIFRTESLGVSFEKDYATTDSIVVKLTHESYSKVSSATVGIYDTDGSLVNYQSVYFNNESVQDIKFDGLESNKTYMIKLYDILCSGVIVNDGFSQKENITTLKKAPIVGELDYTISKNKSSFDLDIDKVIDEDYGITNYRYELYDARQNMDEETPVITIDKDTLSPATVKVDDSKVYHGIAYTYRLIVTFNDNEKEIEYAYNLGSTMQLDGVEFPTLRWQGSKVNWEQINGSIIIDDPSNTIMSDTYKVVYKNSIDAYETQQITATTDRYSIPITVNYLRADETYTFDVYASINLQDGNPTTTETYIGSVKVQTKKPNNFVGIFSTNNNLDDVFSINFSLADETEDASFEANTLSSLTFTLYQGSTIEGRVEASIKDTDKNDDEYTSTLKTKFYDNTAVINAEFFNAQNSDFKQKTYTLVVDQAYDYTKYDSNIIPIKNNVFQFEVNNYIPSLPNLDESQLTVNKITNRTAESFGLDYNSDLEANTTVGYHVIANYDNAGKTAKYLIYHVWRKNQTTGDFELLPNLDRRVNFDASGNMSPIIFEVGNGTDDDVLDSDMLRRGNEYYFSYEAFLDIDNNGSIETHYPTDIDPNAVLKSDIFTAYKQTSDFTLYPSISDNTSSTWKYKAKDVDKAIFDGKLYAFKNAETNPISTSNITVNNPEYLSAKFTGLTEGNILTIRKNEKLLKTEGTNYSILTSQYFYGYKDALGLKYNITNDVNKILLKIDNYTANAALVKRISNVDITITPTVPHKLATLGVKTLNNLDISTGSVVIDCMDISEYIGTPLKFEMIAHFDSGNTGFDITSPFKAVQKGTFDTAGNYYRISGSRLVQGSSLSGNMMDVNVNFENNQLSLVNLSGSSAVVNFTIDSTGVVYQNNNILLKEIKDETINTDNDTTQFDYIIPSISLYKNNKIDAASFLTSVKLNAELLSTEYSNIRDNLIYIDLFEIDENGINANFIETLSRTVEEFEQPIEITDLKPKTNYYVKFYTYIYNSDTGSYEKKYLYDADQKIIGINYYFHTLSDVGISNIQAHLQANSYTDKKLIISYRLDTLTGYDYIEYKLYKYTENGYVLTNKNIPNSRNFVNSMTVSVDASPNQNNDIEYEGAYKIEITPIGSYVENGETKTITLGTYSQEFTIEKYEEPYIAVSSGKTSDSIYFKVSINDVSKLIVNDRYNVTLYDEDNNIVATQRFLSVNVLNRRFTYNAEEYNLEYGKSYKFVVSADVDYLNKGHSFVNKMRTREVTFGGDIYLGTVMFQNSTDDNGTQLNFVFADSYNLNHITSVSYSITSMNSGYYYSNNQTFSARYEPVTDLYYYSILMNEDDYLPNTVYVVSLNFYENNNLVETVEFDYYEGGT